MLQGRPGVYRDAAAVTRMMGFQRTESELLGTGAERLNADGSAMAMTLWRTARSRTGIGPWAWRRLGGRPAGAAR